MFGIHVRDRCTLMKRHLLALDPLSLESKLPCFEITAIADDHVQQSFAIILARYTIRIAGAALAATFANVAKMIHSRPTAARNMPRIFAQNLVKGPGLSARHCCKAETCHSAVRPSAETLRAIPRRAVDRGRTRRTRVCLGCAGHELTGARYAVRETSTSERHLP